MHATEIKVQGGGCGFAGCYDGGRNIEYEQGDPDARSVFEALMGDSVTDWMYWLHGGDYDEDEHVKAERHAEQMEAQALKALEASTERALVAWVTCVKTGVY